MRESGRPAVALTIAGSDSGAGAGLQADLKTMAALGVFAATAVTAVTAQNTATVTHVHPVPEEVVEAQIRTVLDDLPVAAVKTGMLGTAGVVELVGRLAAADLLPRLVVDPVLVSSTGRPLMDEPGVDAYRRALLPRALVVTPNLWEAARLTGIEAADGGSVASMTAMARRIHDLGPTWVLVKGGHLPGVESASGVTPPDQVADVLFDGREVTVLVGPRVGTTNTHGTGCSLSSAITAGLALGAEMPAAVAAAKEFVHDALVGGARWRLGRGHGPLDHFGWSGRPPGAPGIPG